MLTIGIVGKTNTGKTTLFNAATLLNAKISNLPFTTQKPNMGTAYVCDIDVCRELGVKDADAVKALEMATRIRPERYTILHKLNLNFEACEKALQATGIID